MTKTTPSVPAQLSIRENVALAPYTTIGIGGAARFFTEAHTVEELREQLAWARERSLPLLVLGGGSNLLIADAGFPGLVIRTDLRGIKEEIETDGRVVLQVASGEDWDAFVQQCVKSNLAGLECLSGIPGCVGASPIQNIGAYGQEVKGVITEVEALDRTTGQLRTFSNPDLQFSYRMSRFKAQDRDRFIVTAVKFELQRGATPSVRYGDLTRHFEAAGIRQPTIQQVRTAVLEIRAKKAMVVDPAEPNSRSCGSFFMNPVVTMAEHERIVGQLQSEQALKAGETMPAFDAGAGAKKLSAAWLMEKAGLRKGMTHGNVGLSEKHVLAIVNRGGGTAAEVLELVKLVQRTVHEKFGIQLEPEPVFVGFTP